MRILESVVVKSPVEEVFTFVADPAGWTEWASAFHEIDGAPEHELREGDMFRARASFLGKEISTDFEVTEFRRPSRFTYRAVRGPAPGTFTWTFAETDGGTLCTFTVQGMPTGAARLMAPLAAAAARTVMRRDLARLKEILEAAPPE